MSVATVDKVTDTDAAKAADVIERAKPQLQKLKAELDPAEKVMKAWFREHPDRKDFRGRIGYSKGTQKRLDTDKVKLHLGTKLARFLKVVTVETLSVLKR